MIKGLDNKEKNIFSKKKGREKMTCMLDVDAKLAFTLLIKNYLGNLYLKKIINNILISIKFIIN